MQQTKKITLIVCFIVSLLLLTRVLVIRSYLIDTCAAWCAYPVILLQDTIVAPFVAHREHREVTKNLVQLVAEYKQKVAELRAVNRALQGELSYARDTASLESFSQRYHDANKVLGQIILKHTSPTEHFFLVDAGSNRGITVDMIAVHEHCLVGRVTEVHPAYCKVTLITDALSKVPVIGVVTRSHGIHEGTYQRETTALTFVSHLDRLEVGELLVTSGDGLVYPQGFSVGTIETFHLNELGLSYVVTVKPCIDIATLRYCCLLSKGAVYTAPPALASEASLNSEATPSDASLS